MENKLRTYHWLIAIIVFIAAPLLIYFMGDFPRRTALKELLSLVTLLGFFVMIVQFYLSRANAQTLREHKMGRIIKWHKVLGYTFVGILIFHPFFIVLPRFFEAGISPKDAFITLITSFNTTAVLLGIIAYVLMLCIGLTSIFRDKLPLSYKVWRVFHGILSMLFIAFAAFHVTSLGRHMNVAMTSLITILSIGALTLLLKQYLFSSKKQSHELK